MRSKKQIKDLRIWLDNLGLLAQRIQLNRNVYNCIEYIFMSKAWLGKLLGQLGEESPYTNDGNRHSIEDIEPTADTGDIKWIIPKYEAKNNIERIDYLRERLKELSKTIYSFKILEDANLNDLKKLYLVNAYSDACKARMFLGFELESIRENIRTKNMLEDGK